MLTRTPLLRVLWQQDLSRLKPPAVLSGLINGRHALLRYADAHARTSAKTLADVSKTAFSSSQAAADASPITIENVSDGSPFLSFTPCDASDLIALLAYIGQAHTAARSSCPSVAPDTYLARRCEAARGTVSWMRDTLAAHVETLAAAESLERGVPLPYARAALQTTHTYLSQSLAVMTEMPERAAEDLPVATDASAQDATQRDGDVIVLVTAAEFSLAHTLHAAARYLLAGGPRVGSAGDQEDERVISSLFPSTRPCGPAPHLIWCPSVSTSLSAQWWMWSLRESLRRRETHISSSPRAFASFKTDATDVLFDALLLADPIEALAQAVSAPDTVLTPSSLHTESSCSSATHTRRARPAVHVRYVGFTPAAARSHEARLRRALARRTSTPSLLASEAAEVPDVPAVGLVTVGTEERNRKTIPTSSSVPVCRDGASRASQPCLSCEAIADALLFQRGLCPVLPSFVPCTSLAVHASPRCPLVFAPEDCAAPLLRTLVHHHLRGRAHRHPLQSSDETASRRSLLGHSLDASTQMGPLHSSAHLAAAMAVLTHATTKTAPTSQRVGASARERSIRWQHVSGGFALPLTATSSGCGGYYWLPAVLYTDLPRVNQQLTASRSRTDAAADAVEGMREDLTTRADAESAAAGVALQRAVAAVCSSVRLLTEDLEMYHGGTSGVVLFVCSYPSSVEDVSDIAAVAQRVAEACDMTVDVVPARVEAP